MAKDGAYRGGRRVKAGTKPQSAVDKLQKGKEVRVMMNDIPDLEITDMTAVKLPEGVLLEGMDMPKPDDYLSTKQKDGKLLGADEIYKETWL